MPDLPNFSSLIPPASIGHPVTLQNNVLLSASDLHRLLSMGVSVFRFLTIFFLTTFAVSVSAASRTELTEGSKNLVVEDEGRFISATVTGEVTYGERQRFIFFKSDCENVQHLFSWLTYEKIDFSNWGKKVVPVEINGQLRGAEVILQYPTMPAMMGTLIMFSLGKVDHEWLLNKLREQDRLTIKMVDVDDYQASKYFDVRVNYWSMVPIERGFRRAYAMCLNASKENPTVAISPK